MRIIQVIDALDYGDGVSNDVINKYNLLREMGMETEIYSKWFHDKVNTYRYDIDKLKVKENDILLHHFSGKNHTWETVLKANCKKVLVYHNITPAEFFNNSIHGERCSEGEQQLLELYKYYNYYLAVSEFNVQSLKQLGINKDVDVLPILIDFSKIDRLLKNKRKKNTEIKTFLFVGRVAPNKKHEDIIDLFEYYFKNINCNSKLVFVGNYADYMDYFDKLQNKINNLYSSKNIIFTGKIDDEHLYQYYLDADVFICMSEHEGFCIPLLESMYFGIPTIAFDAGAIHTTMGDAGILIKHKSAEKIAKLIHVILTNENIQKQIVDKQYAWVRNFSREFFEKKINILIDKWSGGNIDE